MKFLKQLEYISTLSEVEVIQYIYNKYLKQKEKILYKCLFIDNKLSYENLSALLFQPRPSIYTKQKLLLNKIKILYTLLYTNIDVFKKEYESFYNTLPESWKEIYDSIFCNSYKKIFKKYNLKDGNRYLFCNRVKSNKNLSLFISLILKNKQQYKEKV